MKKTTDLPTSIPELQAMVRAQLEEIESLVKLTKTTGKSHQAVAYFQKLYAIEKIARDGKYTPAQRFELRFEKAKPILD